MPPSSRHPRGRIRQLLVRHFVEQQKAIVSGALGALLFCPAVTTAQRVQSSLDVGATSLRYADSLSASAVTFTPDLRFEVERALAQVTGTFSQFREGGWSAQGTMSGSLFMPTTRGLLGEVAGLAGGSTHQDGTRTGQAIVNARLHAMGARTGYFAGAGGGGTWDGDVWRRLLLGEAGGWVQSGPGTVLLTITPVAVDDSVRYLDAQLSLSRIFSRFEVSALAGGRAGGQNPGVETRTRSWGSLSAVAWLIPRVALVASGGTYPVDPTQGFPGGRFVSLSVRFATPQARGAIRSTPTPEPAPVLDTALPQPVPILESFGVGRQTPGKVVLRIRAASAQLVEVTGDFTGWTPVKLQPVGGGLWTGTYSLARGQYQMNVRVDGGTWLVPPGLLSLKDEFGGSIGLLVIE